MRDIIGNLYQREYVKQAKAKAQSEHAEATKKSLAKAAPTKASVGHTKVKAPEQKSLYKMKQFQQVESRVKGFMGHDEDAAEKTDVAIDRPMDGNVQY